MFSVPDDLEGIGGWLILVAIGLVVSPVYILGTTAQTYLPLMSNSTAEAYLKEHSALRALIVFEVITNIIFVLLLAAINYLFFTKRRSFPTFFILNFILQITVIFADLVLAHRLLPNVPVSSKGIFALLRGLVGGAIWIPYMLISKRVKATFVR